MPVERVEPRMHLQAASPPAATKARNFRARSDLRCQMAAAKISVQEREEFEFEFRDAAIVEPFARRAVLAAALQRGIGESLARRCALLKLRHQRHRNVQDIEKMPARRAVWAASVRDPPAPAHAGDSSRRIRRRATPAQRIKALQIAEIPDTPILARSQRIQLHGDAPQSPAGDNGRGLVALVAAETISRQRSAAPAGDLRLEFVIARRQINRQLKMPPSDPRSFDLASARFPGNRRSRSLLRCAIRPRGARTRAMATPNSRAVTLMSMPIRAPRAAATGGRNLRPAGRFEPMQLERQLGRCVDGASHGAQQRRLVSTAEELQFAAIVVVGIADPAQPRQPFDECPSP